MDAILRKKKRNPFATDGVVKILNYRIEQEENSSRLYEAMSLWLNDNGYLGAAKEWMKYSGEEKSHADWAKNYLLDMGIQPKLPLLKEPIQMFTGFPEIIRMSYDHEIDVTKQCNDLANQALKSGDNLLYQLGNKYMQEQQEELGKLQNLLDKLEAFGEDKLALRLLDNELGS